MTRRIAAAAALVMALFPACARAHEEGTTNVLLKAMVSDAAGPAAELGSFGQPFTEPTIDGRRTDAKCVQTADPGTPLDDNRYRTCKPAGVSLNVLADRDVMYYDGLEGTENVRYSIVAEYGHNAGNDQSRLLDLHGPTWTVPKPSDGGANPKGYANDPLFPPPLSTTEPYNDGALFCSDNKFLADGRVISLGGTAYYLDPGVENGDSAWGVSELEGLRSSRIYDPRSNTWSVSGEMKYGRWYPTAITLPNGKLMVASGVTKLLKPAYPSHPEDSGTNVTQTETYDPVAGRWTTNPASASRSLPLFPRLHLLPDGRVFYNAAGQSFNPAGQAYDEATWNEAAVYDPATQSWTDIGIPGASDGQPLDPAGDPGNPAGDVQGFGIPGGGSAFTIPGFRGSTFSIMLPLAPDAAGKYTKASFLTAGGVLNPPSPGSYFATSDARITTVDTADGKDTMSTRPTGDLGEPRWYPSGVLLPTGQVLAFNGSDRDEVAGPGVEIAIQKTELYDPQTGKWSTLASSHQPRTYHNTAVLLPDGRVLVGGHAPISTLYLNDTTLPGGFAPHDGRDPSFEIYSPPYLFHGARPKIEDAPDRVAYGSQIEVETDVPASEVDSVVLVRNPSVTHLIDADQRNVMLRVLSRNAHTLRLAAPPNGAVAPPGPYMLFVNRKGPKGLVPSVSHQTFVGIGGLERRARTLSATRAR
jgi:Galactose oxidase-like, Early set domain